MENTIFRLILNLIILLLLFWYIWLIKTSIKRYYTMQRLFRLYMNEGVLLYGTPEEEDDFPYLYSIFYGMYIYGSSFKEFYKYARIYLRNSVVVFKDFKQDFKKANVILYIHQSKKHKLTFELYDAETKLWITERTVKLSNNCDKDFINWIDKFIKYYLNEKTGSPLTKR